MAMGLDDEERDAIVNRLQNDVHTLQELVRNRESELIKLHREIHKLKVRGGAELRKYLSNQLGS